MELPTWGTRGTNEHQQLTLRTTPDGEPAMRIPRSDDPEDQPQAGTSTSAIANIYRGALGLFEKRCVQDSAHAASGISCLA